MDQQRKCPGCDETLIDGDFIIKYDVNRAKDLGDIQVSSQQIQNHLSVCCLHVYIRLTYKIMQDNFNPLCLEVRFS